MLDWLHRPRPEPEIEIAGRRLPIVLKRMHHAGG